MRSHYCGEVTAAHLDQIVTLCGWVHRRRDHGGVIFIDLRDRAGLAQIVCDPDRAEMFATAESVRNEYVLKITGKVRRRPAGTENPDLASGEIEVLCHEIDVLNVAATPPFQLDDEHISENVRLTHRVIDLRRAPMQKNLHSFLAVLLLVLCDLAVFLHSLELFHSVTSDRTDSHLGILSALLNVLYDLLTSVLGELRECKADNLTVVLRIYAYIRSLYRFFDRFES